MKKRPKQFWKYTKGTAISWTVDQSELLDELIRKHDLVLSLLPYTHHVSIAEVHFPGEEQADHFLCISLDESSGCTR